MVREHVDELRLVRGVEQVVEDGLGQRGERLVGGREDGERAGAGERVGEAAGLERGDERGEVGRGHGEVDDRLAARAIVLCVHSHRQEREEYM